jgi:hypothetical protein
MRPPAPWLTGLIAAATLAGAGAAQAALPGKVAKAQARAIEAEYDAAQTRCKPLKRHAKDVCLVQARGERDIAMAELDMRHEPTSRHDEKLRMARAEAAYALARENCEPLAGHAKEVCRKDAKAAFAHAQAEAKLQAEAGADALRASRRLQERTEAEERQREAMFAAARQRCEALAGEQREDCVISARKRYGRL